MYLSYVTSPFCCIYDVLFAVDYLFEYVFMFVFETSPRTNSIKIGRNEGSNPGVYVGHSGTGTGFSQNASVFLCHYHPTSAPYSHFIYLRSTLFILTKWQHRPQIRHNDSHI